MRAASVCLAAVLAGCGYYLAGSGSAVPPGATSMSIAGFGNHSREPGLEVALRRAIEEEFRSRGPLSVKPDPEGDLVISGTIRRFQTTPVAFTGVGEAVQFQGILQIAFKLVQRSTGKVIYENKLLQESLDFASTSNVAVTTSPHFQRKTINARDLAQMTNVQLSESQRRATLGDLLDLIARDVYVQSMEGF
jgi:hypothetical protein